MRSFGFLLKKNSGLNPPAIPGARLARVHQAPRRRLDDDVEEVFRRACGASDLDAATDLLEVLERCHARRTATYGRDRRLSGEAVLRARRDLERLSATRQLRASCS